MISWRNDTNQQAMGGTELMASALEQRLDPKLSEPFQITAGRFRGAQPGKIEILWLHDLPGDPETEHLKNGGWNQFERIVFVSNWQMQRYVEYLGMPWYKGHVIQNAIEPIAPTNKSTDKIKIIYHTTPHRGLDIIVPVFEKLAEEFKNIELDVYSSFSLYGWSERDAPYEHLFERCRQHPQINYHGAVSNQEVRQALQQAHIFAYPSTWLETSCISLVEAMSAGCLCIHPNYGALYETASNWTWMYQWQQDKRDHAVMMYNHLRTAIINWESESIQTRIQSQKLYTDMFYNWDYRTAQWNSFLQGILENKNIKIPE